MKPKRTHRHFLADILANIDRIEQFVGGVDREAFAANVEKQYAVIHALQTIGEAARHLPKSLRAGYPSVPWEDIVGMRDMVIHEYFGVDMDIIWETVQRDLPPLKVVVQSMLSIDEGEGE